MQGPAHTNLGLVFVENLTFLVGGACSALGWIARGEACVVPAEESCFARLISRVTLVCQFTALAFESCQCSRSATLALRTGGIVRAAVPFWFAWVASVARFSSFSGHFALVNAGPGSGIAKACTLTQKPRGTGGLGWIADLLTERELCRLIKLQTDELVFAEFVCAVAGLTVALRGRDTFVFDAQKTGGAVGPFGSIGIIFEAAFALGLCFGANGFAHSAAISKRPAGPFSSFAVGVDP